MTTEKHSEIMMRLAKQHIKAVLAGTRMTLRDVSADGLQLESDANVTDLALSNTLHSLASNWGYQHGQCPITVEQLEGGFYAPAKRASIKFV